MKKFIINSCIVTNKHIEVIWTYAVSIILMIVILYINSLLPMERKETMLLLILYLGFFSQGLFGFSSTTFTSVDIGLALLMIATFFVGLLFYINIGMAMILVVCGVTFSLTIGLITKFVFILVNKLFAFARKSSE